MYWICIVLDSDAWWALIGIWPYGVVKGGTAAGGSEGARHEKCMSARRLAIQARSGTVVASIQ